MATKMIEQIVCDLCPKNNEIETYCRCYVCGNDVCYKHKHHVRLYSNVLCEPYLILHEDNETFTVCSLCHEKMIKYENKVNKKESKVCEKYKSQLLEIMCKINEEVKKEKNELWELCKSSAKKKSKKD